MKLVRTCHLKSFPQKQDAAKMRKQFLGVLAERGKALEFKKWLAIFFINRGLFRITDKGYCEFSPQIQKQFLEFAEQSGDREYEERIERRYALSKRELRRIVGNTVKRMLDEGKAEELYCKGLVVRAAHMDWKQVDVRVSVVKKLAEMLGKDARALGQTDFSSNGLDGLLIRYGGSHHAALFEAGFVHSEEETIQHGFAKSFSTDRLYPWELKRVGNKFWESAEIRIAATEWLIWKSKKPVREIETRDYIENGLSGLLDYCNNSSVLPLIEAGYVYSIDETLEQSKARKFDMMKLYVWEMLRLGNQSWDNVDIQLAATRWLISKIIKKSPKEISADDFEDYGLTGLLARCEGSPFSALAAAGYAYTLEKTLVHSKIKQFGNDKFYFWEMPRSPFIYADMELRIAAIRWLAWISPKSPTELTRNDFDDNCLSGLLNNYYNGSPFNALFEAGLVGMEDERYMRSNRHGQLSKV